MTPRTSRLHAVKPRERLDRTVLLLAFLLGAGGGALAKLTGLEPEWIAAIWSALVLFGYAAAAWALGQLRIEPETIGDNCYYLGFLFTLTSLAVTLYQLGGDAGGDVMRDIISGFGIALSSTIVGVFMRVLLMQIRPDIVARDREARVELHTAAREFRGALAASAAEIKAFSTESVQLTAERSEKIRAASDAALDVHRDQLAKSADLFADVLKTALAAASEKAVSGIGDAITKSTKATLDEVRRSTEALGESLEAFRKRESEAFTMLADRTERLGVESGKTRTALSEVTERLVVFSAELEALTERLEAGLGKAVAGLEATASETVAHLRTSLSEIETAASSGAAVLRLDAAAEALQMPLGALEATADRLIALLDRIEASATAQAPKAANPDAVATVRSPDFNDRPRGWFQGWFGARPNPDLPRGR